MPFKSDGRIDWAAIRAAYEAGGISDRALAREHGIWLRAIQTKAESENWERPDMPKDHGGPVSRAQAIAAQPSSKITQPAEPSNQLMVKPQKPVTDVAVSHKDVITRSRSLVYRLLDELDATTSHIGEIEQMILDETAGDRDGRRRHTLQQAVNLSTRAGVMKNLALAAKTLAEAAPGKREEEAEAAQKAASGIFAMPAGPKLLARRSSMPEAPSCEPANGPKPA